MPNLGLAKYTDHLNESALVLRYEQLLGKSIDKAWKAPRTPEALQEAHQRKILLIEDGVKSIAEVMNELHLLLCRACGHLAISDTPRDLQALYVAWLMATDLKSAISNSSMKIGDLRGAALTKDIFTDVATQVKIEVKQKVEADGNHSTEDADQLMEEWFYFVFGKTIGTAPASTSTSSRGKENCQRVVYDAHEVMIDGKAEKPLYQPKPFVEISAAALAWMESIRKPTFLNNMTGKMKKQSG